MKIRKPDDEKFFKDIVLNDILEEISNEDGTSSKPIKKKSSKKKLSGKRILFITVLSLLIITTGIIFKYVSDATTVVKETPKITTPDKKQEWKMDEDRSGYKKTVLPTVVKKEPVINIEFKSKTAEIKPIPIQKTERELAKEALKQQMLN